MPAVRTETAAVVLPAEGLRVEAGTLKEPGFLRLIARIEDRGDTFRGVGTTGFAPERIQAVAKEPEDFDQFWTAAKAALARVPMNPTRTAMPERTTQTLDRQRHDGRRFE